MRKRKFQLGIDIEKIDHIISRSTYSYVTKVLKGKITAPQAYVIDFILHCDKEDIFQKDLEEEFDLKRSAVSLMLNNMEKNSFIKRIPVPEDARLKKIILTDKALELSEQITTAIDEIENTVAEDLSQDEIDTFYTVLEKMRNSLKKKNY